jgi:hypothetical protein
MVAFSNTEFGFPNLPTRYRFIPPKKKSDRVTEVLRQTPDEALTGRRVVDTPLTASQLAEYAGDYFSSELATFWTVESEEGQIVLRSPKNSVILHPLDPDTFSSNFGRISFERDGKHRIARLSYSNGRVLNAVFYRVKRLELMGDGPDPHLIYGTNYPLSEGKAGDFGDFVPRTDLSRLPVLPDPNTKQTEEIKAALADWASGNQTSRFTKGLWEHEWNDNTKEVDGILPANVKEFSYLGQEDIPLYRCEYYGVYARSARYYRAVVGNATRNYTFLLNADGQIIQFFQ